MKNQNELGQPIGTSTLGWQIAGLPTGSKIIGEHCNITPLNIDQHSESLYQSFSKDPKTENWTYLPYGPFDSLQEFKSWLTSIANKSDPYFCTIVDKSSNSAIGLASYLRINPNQGVIEVGHIHFSPLLQRTALATEAMFLMMRHVFEELGYRRYEWKCDSLNEKSRKAAKRLGFTFEGIFRQALMYKNRNRDTAWYSVIDSEWPKLKRNFQEWLAPSNFDAKGNQKISLGQVGK